MSALLIGYARCSTDAQDLTAQRDALATLGVSPSESTSTTVSPEPTESAPGYMRRSPLAGPATLLVVTKLDRLARSLPDARSIADELTDRSVRHSASVGRSTTQPTRSAGCCSACWPWSPNSRPT